MSPNVSIMCDEMATSTEEGPKKKLQPQLMKLEKAFKLAEQWVNNMSKSSENEKSPLVELEGRPSRLGIGATVPKESKVMRSNNPVERKLLAKLHAEKRKVDKRDEDMAPSAKDGNVDEDSEEEELESKTRAFAKKRPLSMTSPNTICIIVLFAVVGSGTFAGVTKWHSTEEDPKKKLLPSQLVKLEKAFKMAEQWVNNMSKSSVNEKSPLVELEGHPSRIGIGATVPKESEVMHSNNPVEQKLLAKLHTDKRKVVKREEDIVPSAKDRIYEDSEEEELESKTRAFAKKRPLSLTSPVHAKKKHR
ncbi:hypothetical protein Pfo_001202 [Paulownia fortunei]|nr:hypothetical protein Pfo_001202 [Paulownia fortunei]